MTVPHSDAKRFPMMSEAELAELAADIAANGLHEAIKLDPTGEFIVDGRNREVACKRADVAPHYECLPLGTDIFAYVISANLHRRHLTDEQRREVAAEIKIRNPELSNREVAKRAGVSPSTVDRLGSCSTASPEAVEHKTVGADGKSRPASGKISEVTRAAVIADLKKYPWEQRDIAERHGVSVGTVAGIKRRLKSVGSLAKAGVPTIAEQLAKRAVNLPRFDTMTREERGMGSPEYGAEQHPDYPPGWTRDNVHREKYGRIQIYTPAQIEEQALAKRSIASFGGLKTFVENALDIEDLDRLSDESLEFVDVQLGKYGPRAIDLISGYLARIKARKAPKLTIVKP
jgi:ParB-like chromosome segregation protein Spo0J